MDKQNMVYAYDGIFLSHKNTWNTDTCYNMYLKHMLSKKPIHKRPHKGQFCHMKCPE